MNNLQLVASAISGYEPDETSAKDNYYYELTSHEDKLQQIDDYASNVYGIQLSAEQAQAIYKFLEREQGLGENETYYAFKALNPQE